LISYGHFELALWAQPTSGLRQPATLLAANVPAKSAGLPSNLRRGDLVFFYRGISHVGLYAGNGKVIHAPRPGKRVSYIKISYMPYMGARRPG
jgi:cell wall-associated NlpC family hydrolase